MEKKNESDISKKKRLSFPENTERIDEKDHKKYDASDYAELDIRIEKYIVWTVGNIVYLLIGEILRRVRMKQSRLYRLEAFSEYMFWKVKVSDFDDGVRKKKFAWFERCTSCLTHKIFWKNQCDTPEKYAS